MCGIVAYIGTRPAQNILIEGLKRLEYRGYDSAGVATIDGGLRLAKAVGRVFNVEEKIEALRDKNAQVVAEKLAIMEKHVEETEARFAARESREEDLEKIAELGECIVQRVSD